jgi:hypothetical protein
MSSETYPYQSKLLAEREARGEAQGEAKALLLVVERRGLHLTENQRRRIEQCRDPAQLAVWLKRVGVVPSVADILA